MTTSGRRAFAWHGERQVNRRAVLATAVGLVLSLSRGAPAAVPAVDMADVRRLARDPIETIFAGVAIGRVSDLGSRPEPTPLAAVDKQYGVKKVPASLFYDNDHGGMELEKTDYSVPLMLEYRTPSMLFWKTYHQAIREYIQKNILD